MMTRWLSSITVTALARTSGLRFDRELARLREEVRLPRDELTARRDRRLRRLVHHAYHEVPLYRRLLDEAGVDPRAVDTCRDLERLPIVDKPMLRDAFADGAIARNATGLIPKSTSGTQGMPLRMVVDRAQRAVQMARTTLMFELCGVPFGAPVSVIAAQADTRSRQRRLYEWVKRERRFHVVSFDRDTVARLYEDLVAARGALLQGGVTPLLVMAEHMEQIGDTRLRPSVVHAIGEQLFPADRDRLARALGATIVSVYGSNEIYGIAQECIPQARMHVFPDVIAEIVDERGRPVADGTLGRIILTDLTNTAMPFLRYDIGDLGRSIAGACACGSQMPMIELGEGRISDRLSTPGGKVLSAPHFSQLVLRFPWVRAFQVAQTEPDRFVLRVEVGESMNGDSIEALRAEAARLVDDTAVLDVERYETLPVPRNGKRRVFVTEPAGIGVER